MNKLQEKAAALLSEGTVKLIIGFEEGINKARPLFCSKAEDVARMIYSEDCDTNNAVYLTKKDLIGEDKSLLSLHTRNLAVFCSSIVRTR